eukprot:6777545-Prymnesium_polylepis.1
MVTAAAVRAVKVAKEEADGGGRHDDRKGRALATPQQGRCPRQCQRDRDEMRWTHQTRSAPLDCICEGSR